VALYLHSPNTPSWHGTQLKHRDNFTFYLPPITEKSYKISDSASHYKICYTNNFNNTVYVCNVESSFWLVFWPTQLTTVYLKTKVNLESKRSITVGFGRLQPSCLTAVDCHH